MWILIYAPSWTKKSSNAEKVRWEKNDKNALKTAHRICIYWNIWNREVMKIFELIFDWFFPANFSPSSPREVYVRLTRFFSRFENIKAYRTREILECKRVKELNECRLARVFILAAKFETEFLTRLAWAAWKRRICEKEKRRTRERAEFDMFVL